MAAEPSPAVGSWDFIFSNFAPCPVLDSYGIEYLTVEHAYQASKTLDAEVRLGVAALLKPGEAKRAGRLLTVRPDWEHVKLAVMYTLLCQKFAWGTAYGARLLASGTQALCETNHWHDNEWGNCVCPALACQAPGANWLGRLLMLRRACLAEVAEAGR